MNGYVPAIKIAILFDKRINPSNKGMGAIHDGNFLVQRFDGMMPYSS